MMGMMFARVKILTRLQDDVDHSFSNVCPFRFVEIDTLKPGAQGDISQASELEVELDSAALGSCSIAAHQGSYFDATGSMGQVHKWGVPPNHPFKII